MAIATNVGNGMWVTEVTDPDGYNLSFQSATDVAEETVVPDNGWTSSGALCGLRQRTSLLTSHTTTCHRTLQG